MTAYKFQPAYNNPYLQLNQTDEDELTMKSLNSNELSSGENYLSGNTETVLDLIEHNYTNKNLIDIENRAVTTSGINASNPNLFSRKQQNSPV